MNQERSVVGAAVVSIIMFAVCNLVFDIDSVMLMTLISLGVGCLSIPIFGAIINAKDSANDQKNQEMYEQCTEKTKNTIGMIRKKINTEQQKTLQVQAIMNANDIIMVLGNAGDETRRFYIIADKNTGCCMVDSKSGKYYPSVPSFILKEYVANSYKYNDPKLVYTGATVGGIHTGGFHVEGGDYSQKKTCTGKYSMMLSVDGETFLVDRVYCNSAIWKKAKSTSFLSEYEVIDNGCYYLQFMHKLSYGSIKNLEAALSTGDLYGRVASARTSAETEMLLSSSECNQVKTWISRRLNEYSAKPKNN